MKIVLFINSLSSGGSEHQLVVLADGLAERGHEVTITSWADLVDHYKYDSRVTRHRIAEGKNNVFKLLSMLFYFLTVKADWIIPFGQRESFFCLKALQFRFWKKPRVIAGERNTTYGAPSKLEKVLMNQLYRSADYIIPNSYAQRNHIITTKPEYEKKTITITNFTDLAEYQCRPLPNHDVLHIGVFGRYDPQKNCMRFVEAISLLKKKTDRSFVIEWFGNQRTLGEEPNPFYVDMMTKVKEKGLEDNILLHDHIKDVSKELLRFDAFCLPSLWEGFSNSISEAICCGRPCIVSNVADNGLMVHNGENGFLFDPHSEEEIVKAFLRFFNLDSKSRQLLGDNSRKRAEELFDFDRFIYSYEQLLIN